MHNRVFSSFIQEFLLIAYLFLICVYQHLNVYTAHRAYTGLSNFLGIYDDLDLLDVPQYTRFTPISSVSIGTLIDELFIETWQNTSSYSDYFSTCAPLTCRCTYVQRNESIFVLITFLGLYGGLTIGLKFVVWHVLCIYWKIHQWFTNLQRRIEPQNEN